MEQAMELHSLVSKTFKLKMNQVLNENERLMKQVINKDIVNIVVISSVDNASVSMHECEKCLKLKTKLLNKKDFIEKETYDKLFRIYTTLVKHCIYLEVDAQQYQENFQMDNSISNQSTLSFYQYFELNELKAQSQEKDMVIRKLKEIIKSLSGNMNKDKVTVSTKKEKSKPKPDKTEHEMEKSGKVKVKTKAADYGHIKWIEDLVTRTMWIQEPIDYDKHALWGVSHWGHKRQHYKHLDWITIRRDDDKLYKFKEGDYKRLGIQDIEDILLLLVQGKLTNLTAKEHFAFNVSLWMFTRSIVIQRRVEDLQLGFIYQNKDKKNRLIWIDELHKFSDGTLTDVRTSLDDRLKGIQMRYLLQTIWRKSDKDIAAAMIQAIDKRLKTRRIIKSLERFVEGRLYEGDYMMLQRTI
nr:hypothetical protein [Tanacetum cinerariifolium]